MGDSSALVRHKQGAAELEVDSGGVITILSGGVLNIKTGGIIKADGVQQSIASLTNSMGGGSPNGDLRAFFALNTAAQTNNTGVATNNAVANVTGSFSQSILNQNFATCIDAVNNLRSDVNETRTCMNDNLREVTTKIAEIQAALQACGILA